jgi:hypothetical protein
MISFEQPVPAFNAHALALIPGDIGKRDVHLPRLIAPRDRQRRRFSDADLFKNSRKIGYVTAGTVEQGTAGISGIERDICLDSASDFMPLGRRYCPAQRADDPRS